MHYVLLAIGVGLCAAIATWIVWGIWESRDRR